MWSASRAASRLSVHAASAASSKRSRGRSGWGLTTLKPCLRRKLAVMKGDSSVAPATEESPFITANFLLRHGFRVVKPHPDLPLLRLELAALAAWTESLEAALEALHIRLAPQRVPGTSAQGH